MNVLGRVGEAAVIVVVGLGAYEATNYAFEGGPAITQPAPEATHPDLAPRVIHLSQIVAKNRALPPAVKRDEAASVQVDGANAHDEFEGSGFDYDADGQQVTVSAGHAEADISCQRGQIIPNWHDGASRISNKFTVYSDTNGMPDVGIFQPRSGRLTPDHLRVGDSNTLKVGETLFNINWQPDYRSPTKTATATWRDPESIYHRLGTPAVLLGVVAGKFVTSKNAPDQYAVIDGIEKYNGESYAAGGSSGSEWVNRNGTVRAIQLGNLLGPSPSNIEIPAASMDRMFHEKLEGVKTVEMAVVQTITRRVLNKLTVIMQQKNRC